MVVSATVSAGTSSETQSETVSNPTAFQRLVTREDPYHIHKTLGILCLVSYAWRIPLAGAHDMGFGSYPEYTLPTLLLHFLLNGTSFVFHIPRKRIKAGGYRIWPEYRLHSFVFLCRSMSYMTLVWYEKNYNLPPNYFWNYAIVIGSIAAADLSSNAQKEHRSPTIRGLDIPIAAKYFFSVAQVLATTGVMWGLRRYSTQFVFCWIIQGNAFLMTLRRKNVGSHGFLIFIYGLLIVVGMGLVNYDQIAYSGSPYTMHGMFMVGHTAVLLRLGPRWIPLVQDNKYVLWTCMFLLTQQVREIVKRMDDPNDKHANLLFYLVFGYGQLTLLAIIGVGFYRHKYGQRPLATEQESKKST
mmetsp:Transcript_8260/g.10818  ORF Transcript_8260/g.10818 Transcript_8260/m.10818 type:complete len:355 (+) Transcript_8260:67-1131(+)